MFFFQIQAKHCFVLFWLVFVACFLFGFVVSLFLLLFSFLFFGLFFVGVVVFVLERGAPHP